MSKTVELVKDKPVATTGLVSTLAVGFEAYAESRGWIPKELAPYALAATVALLSAIAHALVSPAKKVESIVKEGLHLTDADYGRGEVIAQHLILPALLEKLGIHASPTASGVGEVSSSAPIDVPPPDGMSAGHPVDTEDTPGFATVVVGTPPATTGTGTTPESAPTLTG